MAEKRYAIVRADKFCPRALERNYNLKCIGSLHCDKCDLKKTYGDTKEQFTRKIETAIEIAINRYEEGKIKGRNKNRQCAEIIVEFLGVE